LPPYFDWGVVLHLPKSIVVTARISAELKKKIDAQKINVTQVIRASLTNAVEDAEASQKLHEIVESGGPYYTEELKKLTPEQRYEAYRDNKLSPESRVAMETIRKARLNMWEILQEKKKEIKNTK
jgi:hypothetical protein